MGYARYPGAQYRPLGQQTQPRMAAHDIVCLHTMVGNLAGTEAYFRRNGYGGTESHYGIGGRWNEANDGTVYQWQDRDHTADANLDGNWHVISIETADNAPKAAADIEYWTEAQLAAIVALVAWECSLEAHKSCPTAWDCHRGTVWQGIRVAIPPVMITSTRKGNRGLAVHRQGVLHSSGYGKAGYLVAGGERWSTSLGKECPGKRRTAQFITTVIPLVQKALKSSQDRGVSSFMVADSDKNDLRELIINVLKTEPMVLNKPTDAQLEKHPGLENSYFTVSSALANIERDVDVVKEMLSTILGLLTATDDKPTQ